jgi:hypothetical protein
MSLRSVFKRVNLLNCSACSITVLLLRLTGKRVCTTQLPSGRLATAAALTVGLEIGGGKWDTKGMNEGAT